MYGSHFPSYTSPGRVDGRVDGQVGSTATSWALRVTDKVPCDRGTKHWMNRRQPQREGGTHPAGESSAAEYRTKIATTADRQVAAAWSLVRLSMLQIEMLSEGAHLSVTVFYPVPQTHFYSIAVLPYHISMLSNCLLLSAAYLVHDSGHRVHALRLKEACFTIPTDALL